MSGPDVMIFEIVSQKIGVFESISCHLYIKRLITDVVKKRQFFSQNWKIAENSDRKIDFSKKCAKIVAQKIAKK
jgi:hypothetical protein